MRLKKIYHLKLIIFENEDDFIKNSNLFRVNSLIISKTNQKILVNKNVTDKNLLGFKDFPLPLDKFLELINIQLIKLKFNHQSKIDH